MFAEFDGWLADVTVHAGSRSMNGNGEHVVTFAAPRTVRAWVQPTTDATVDEAGAATTSVTAVFRAPADVVLGPFDRVETAGRMFEVAGEPRLVIDPLAGAADHIQAALVAVTG